MSVYTPAEVVEETGFTLDTLRYYEKIGLLEPVERNSSGQRRFSEEHLSWLGMVRCLRDTGMPIAQMLRFAELCRAGDHTIPDRIKLLEEHEQHVQAQIDNLAARRGYIQHKISYYRSVL